MERKELYEFGIFRLDVGEHILEHLDHSKNGSLPEKAFQTLVVLVRNKGRLLTKQELLDHVWPDSFVEENNLDKSIHAIRQVLGEKPGEQKFIETVRKHGYRFVAEVRRIELPVGEGNE
ncbi:MAG: winged helix-turn-helix domain-containing protein, partial [Pyrinomonadaceae bacterium]